MKTLKALKAVAIWNCIFCFSCVASTVFLAIHHYFHLDSYLHIGVLFVYGWMVNPFAIISCFRGLKIYLTERTILECKHLIGKKWIWFVVLPIVTTVLWLLVGGLFVEFTGGV